MVGVFAGTEPVLSGVHSYAGFIDVIDMRAGVRGWAVDLRNPQAGVTLELCVGGLVVASTATVLERDDIASKLGTRAAAGFSFLPQLLETAAGLTAAMDDEITVRVAGSALSLASAGGPCTVADVLNALRAARAPQPASTIADLELLLDSLRAGAATLGERPLLPLPENLQGYLETLAVDAAGQVWFMGWIRRGHVQEFSAVIVERRKFPAALAVMSYTRDDLPPDCCGLVGLISSSWRPSSATSNLHLFFGHEGRFFLKSHTPLRIIPVGELVGEYEGVRDRCLGDGRSTVLQRMLGSLDSWVPTRSVAQSYATETSVDRILLVPGLGCLVEGWVLSPIKRVEGLRLRVGASVMSADANSLYWKPRPDLLEAFPTAVAMTAQAGFVGLFVGDAEPEGFRRPDAQDHFPGRPLDECRHPSGRVPQARPFGQSGGCAGLLPSLAGGGVLSTFRRGRHTGRTGGDESAGRTQPGDGTQSHGVRAAKGSLRSVPVVRGSGSAMPHPESRGGRGSLVA